MTGPFGDGPLTVLRRPGVMAGSEDLARTVAAATVEDLAAAPGPVLLLGTCAPTAAFSRLDTLRPGHDQAVASARRSGFEPVVRPVGGHLAAYDESALVLHLWGPHPEPRRDLRARFSIVADALCGALGQVGVPDARVGPVPGEYCDGQWSVSAGGRAKLVGTGQRLFRRGFLFCAVVSVERADPVREVLDACYADLDLPLDASTVGCVADTVPGVRVADVREVVAGSLVRALADLVSASRSATGSHQVAG